MATANLQGIVNWERNTVRRALALERVRASRCRAALARARGSKLRGRCRRKLEATLGRAAKLALALVDMGEAIPMAQVGTDFDSRLLDAMDLALRRHARLGTSTYACVRSTSVRGRAGSGLT